MARWRLRVAHYINGYPPDLEATEWEYKETDRVNGRERRKRYKVPFHFPEDTVVCYKGQGLETDYVFEGEPTPDMDPLDAEAKAISASLEYKWVRPIESLPGNFGASLLGDLERQVAELASAMPRAPVSVQASGVSKAEFEELKAQLAQLMARNAELETTRRKL